MPKISKKVLVSYMPSEALREYAQQLLDDGTAEDETEAQHLACQDDEYLGDLYESVLDILTDEIRRVNPGGDWQAEVHNFGWLKQNGSTSFHAETGAELIRELLPKTECSFRIYRYGYKGFAIQNFHHDSPWGDEWYTIRPDKVR